MKNLKSLFVILMAFSISITAKAQYDGLDNRIDSASKANKNTVISITLPVKAVKLFGEYMKDRPSWDDEGIRTYLKGRVPNAQTSDDSLVNITGRANLLANYVNWLQAQEQAHIADFMRQIFNNSPAIPGYTGLATQINSLAVGTATANYAANYVKQRYLLNITDLEARLDNRITSGALWIWQ